MGANCKRVRSTIANKSDSALAELKNTAEQSEDVKNNSVFSFSLGAFLFLCLANKEKEMRK